MNSDRIESHEVLFRAASFTPNMWKVNEDRASSALFKDSNGASIDRDDGRSEVECCSFMEDPVNFQIKAIVSVTGQQCLDIGVLPIPKPLEENPFHAEIHDSQTKVTIGSGKATRLAKICRVVKRF